LSEAVARFDLHAHVIPDEYRALLPALPDGSPQPLPAASLESLTEMMERYRIDAAVISTGPPGASVGDPGLARELATLANEKIAGIVRAERSRFAGLAVLPLPDLDGALAELRRALDVLDLDGVALFSNVHGTYLGDPAWDPLFDELDRRGAYVFVHPVAGPYALPLPQWPVWLYEFPFDTTRAIVQLIYSGTLERCPNVRLQLAHLGGAVPFLAHRLASLALREPALAARAPAGVLAYLRRLYYDTGLSNNDVALASTLAAVPLERIVFGTDWPYAALPDGNDPAPDLGLGADDRRGLDAANALALVPRFSAAAAG
jgi:6-methylsalicylate decarboxylase